MPTCRSLRRLAVVANRSGVGLFLYEPTIEYQIDLVVEVQTVRSCQLSAELEPQFRSESYCYPNHRHVAASARICRKRQRIGSSRDQLIWAYTVANRYRNAHGVCASIARCERGLVVFA